MSRPVIYSYPGHVPDSLVNYEILSMHYPSWQGDLDQAGIQTKGFAYAAIPVLFDEWAHVACYNNFELKEDPNVRNFWGQSLDSMWTYTFEADGGLGGAIWCMLDETFMMPPGLPGFNQWWGILDKKVIPSTYMGPCVGYGEWGIVDTWRRKKPEFWSTKKAYSPARVLIKQIDAFIPDSTLRIPVHNRFDHTNFKELRISWKHGSSEGVMPPTDLPPHEKGFLELPASPWQEGEKVHLSFHTDDGRLVDTYSLRLGERTSPVPSPGQEALEVHKSRDRIILRAETFAVDLNRKTGLLENLRTGEDTLLRAGPYLNLRIPGKPLQYSTLPMEDLAENWQCKKCRFRMKAGVATISTRGRYDRARASFSMRIDGKGILEISYQAEAHPGREDGPAHIQESGLKFHTGEQYRRLSWDRESYFTAYPDGHPGAPVGSADLAHRPPMMYREKPGHSWAEDSRNFYYFGLEETLPYTNMVRSLKEHIYRYSLHTASGNELRVLSPGTQACRFDRVDGKNTLIVNELWDYNSLKWGNYMKRIPLGSSVRGKVTMALSP
jgi:hypothetical protein